MDKYHDHIHDNTFVKCSNFSIDGIYVIPFPEY